MSERIDFRTDQGARIKRMLVERLDELRTKLESPDLPERETAVTRGGIAEIKRLLSEAPPYVAPLRYSGMKPDGGM